MRKFDLADICKFMKEIIVPNVPEDFRIADKFRHGLTDDEIRKGIDSFREFLYELFDKLTADKDIIDVKTRDNYNPYDRRDKANIRLCFPTIKDLQMILFTLGIRGKLDMKAKKLTVRTEDLLTPICEKTENYISLIKMSSERKIEMFGILSDLGLRFEGLDLSGGVDFTKIKEFNVTYDKNDFFIIGLKLLAESTQNHRDYYYIMNIFTVLFQCDFYPLANTRPKKHTQQINIFANTQPPQVKNWLNDIDKLLINSGCKMVRSDGCFQYIRRGENIIHGRICKIEINMTGCYIIPNVMDLSQPNNIISLLPENMTNLIKNCKQKGKMGYDRYALWCIGENYEECRNLGIRCQSSGSKCHFDGYSINLAKSHIRELIKKWIELELA